MSMDHRRTTWIIAWIAFGTGAGTPRAEVDANRTAFVGVSVLPMSADTLLSGHTVLVENGVITQVGPRSAIPVPVGTRVVQGNGRVLMPGLTDMHVHLDHEADLERYLAAGVTLVRNMRGEPRHLQWRNEIKAGRRQGPRIITTGPTLTGAVRMNPLHVSVTNGAEISKEVRAQAEAGYDLVKVHSGLSAGLLRLVGAVADSTQQSLVGHLMAGGLSVALAAHQASIEHVDADEWTEASIDGDMAKLAQADAYLCPTFTTFYDGNPETMAGEELRPQPSARHRAMVTAARGHGVKLLAGTDAGLPSRQPGTTLVTELGYMAAAGLSPYETLRTATVNAGDFVRHHAPGIPRVGVLEVGGAADLILLPADPRANLGILARVQGVMVGGRWLDLPSQVRMR
ncbi:MAG TPA: amidohydrolase family protein [Gemmatimonadales bacterium]|nr:amidohydrolase family protein [Gemmatimonadales bacterium]